KGSGAGDPTVGAFGRAAARPKAYRILYNISYARCRQADEGRVTANANVSAYGFDPKDPSGSLATAGNTDAATPE
ncbi:hypothetical protein, partial [Sinorhizobium meliloti]|uniref:hypothetical protein n=1 Tax=Rhizobium meliloti TaxID=382 RepID=UPI001AEC9CA8